MTARRRTLMDEVVERLMAAAASGEDTCTDHDFCAKCGRSKAQGLHIFHRFLSSNAEIDENVGQLNAMDKYMARKPGDEIRAYVICPCCSFEGCPDTERGHRLHDLGQLLRNRYVTRVMWEWPLVAGNTSPDHPEWQQAWPGGPIHRVAPDATCWDAVGHNIEEIDDEGRVVITGYVEAGACGRSQCRNLMAAALAEHTGDPDDCCSDCPKCFPRALVVAAA